MNYELALKLKNAGFSQGYLGEFYITPRILIHRKDLNTALRDEKGGIIPLIDLVYKPTLEELVEVCGTHLNDIRRVVPDSHNPHEWSAGLVWPDIAFGDSAIEAVAHYWLKLVAKD